MNDADIDALGVRVLDNFCVDLAPSIPESEEEDATLEDAVVRSTEPGCEDRVEDQSKPKRKWKRKIYLLQRCVGVLGSVLLKNFMMKYERNLLE